MPQSANLTPNNAEHAEQIRQRTEEARKVVKRPAPEAHDPFPSEGDDMDRWINSRGLQPPK